jgi:hypothetical protein
MGGSRFYNETGGLEEGDWVTKMRASSGTIMEWKAPASASLSDFIGRTFSSGLLLKIKSKTARYINASNPRHEEREAVFMPGTKFRVGKLRSKTHKKSGAIWTDYILDLEEV